MDPYVKLSNKKTKFKTRTHNNGGKKPSWNESYTFNLQEANTGNIYFEIYDKDTLSDDYVCGGRLTFTQLLCNGPGPQRHALYNKNGSKCDGYITLASSFVGTGSPVAEQKMQQQQPAPAYAPQQPAPPQYQAQPQVQYAQVNSISSTYIYNTLISTYINS